MAHHDSALDLRQVFDDLVRFETWLWDVTDELLQDRGQISVATLNLLLVVERVPNCRVQDIARSLAITVGGTSQAVDRAEKAGLCVRSSHPNDRRSSVISLTTLGATVLNRAKPVYDDALLALLSTPLSDEELASLAAALKKLRRASIER